MNNAMLEPMPRGYEQDPMTPAQREHSRRVIADANFQPYGSAIASGIDKAAGVAAGFLAPILNGDLHRSAGDYQIGERTPNAMLPRQAFDAAGGVMMGSSFAQAPKNALRAGMAVGGNLDMSQAARLQRARDMGFNTDTVLYHGTTRGFDAFDLSAPKRTDDGFYGKGVYFAKDPSESAYYVEGAESAQIGPYFARGRRLDLPNDGADIDGFMRWMPILDGLSLLDDSSKTAFQAASRKSDPVDRLNAYLDAGGPSKTSPSGFVEPLLIDEYIAKFSSPEQFSQVVKAAGYDGLNVGGEVIILDPSNIRSVNAAFDPARSGSSNLMASNPFTGAVVPTFTAPEE